MRRAHRSYTGEAAPRSQQGQCRGKRIWSSKSLAEKMARRTADNGGREHDHLAAYHCTSCHGWHVGSSVGTVRATA